MELTIDILIVKKRKRSVKCFLHRIHSSLIGVTDGKAVGTYVEHLFHKPSKQAVYNDRWQQRFRH